MCIAKMQLQESLMYRFNFFTNSIFIVIPLISHICIWQAMFKSGVTSTTMAGYTLQSIVTYTILGHFVDKFTNEVLTQLKISTDIRDGLLNKYLIKPINPIGAEFATHIANSLNSFLTLTITYMIFTFFYHDFFIINHNPIMYLICFMGLLNGILIGFLLNHLIGILTFWLKEVSALYVFTQSTFLFLSGGYMPLDLLPSFIYKFLMLTPFPYLLYFPVSIYVKQYTMTEFISYACIGIMWSVVLIVIDAVVYRRGLKRYTGNAA